MLAILTTVFCFQCTAKAEHAWDSFSEGQEGKEQ